MSLLRQDSKFLSLQKKGGGITIKYKEKVLQVLQKDTDPMTKKITPFKSQNRWQLWGSKKAETTKRTQLISSTE